MRHAPPAAEALGAQHLFNFRSQFLKTVRLLNKPRQPFIGEVLRGFLIVIAAAQNHFDIRANTFHLTEDSTAIYPGHGKVKKNAGYRLYMFVKKP